MSNTKNVRGSTPSRKMNNSLQLIKDIPSAIKINQQTRDGKQNGEKTKAKQNEVNKKVEAKRQNPPKQPANEPSIDGKASLKLMSELNVDQLCCNYINDYNLFATGGADGIIRIYNAENKHLEFQLLGGKDTEGQTSCVTCIKQKPKSKKQTDDNCLSATYVNGLVKYFNYSTKQCLFTIQENRQTYGMEYHPKLPKFITYGDDLKLNFYDLETKTKERVYQGRDIHDGPSSRVFAARFNPASNYEFLTGGWDETVLLWDLRQPHAVRYISNVHLCGEGLDIDPGGKEVLTCSWRTEDPLQLWDYSTFKLISTLYPDVYRCKLYCGRFISPSFLACGGGDPSALRVVDRSVYKMMYLSIIYNDVGISRMGRHLIIEEMYESTCSKADGLVEEVELTSPLDHPTLPLWTFFLWGYVKNLVFQDRLQQVRHFI